MPAERSEHSETDFQENTFCLKCWNSKFFWSVFSRIWTEYGELLCIYPYSVQMHENMDQNNSKYEDFLRSNS